MSEFDRGHGPLKFSLLMQCCTATSYMSVTSVVVVKRRTQIATLLLNMPVKNFRK